MMLPYFLNLAVLLPCLLNVHIGYRGTATAALKLDPKVHSIDTKECGTSLVCLRNPYDCTTTLSCTTFVTTRYNSSTNIVTFEIAAAKQYVAFAQNTNRQSNRMVKISGQYCSKTSGGSFGNVNGNSLTSNGRPTFEDDVDGVQNSVKTVISNSLICKYERPVKPSVASQSLLYNLNDPLLAIVAYGDATNGDGTPQTRHSGYAWTEFPVVFTNSVLFGAEPVLVDNCNTMDKCIRVPSTCTSSYDCDVLAIYRYEASRGSIDVEISTRENFAAFGQTLSSTDEEVKGEVCYKENNVAKLRSFRLPSGSALDVHAKTADGITVMKTYVIPYKSKGSVVCKYTKTVTVPLNSTNYMFDLTEPRRLAYVSGNTITTGDPVFTQGDLTHSVNKTVFVPIHTTSVVSPATSTSPQADVSTIMDISTPSANEVMTTAIIATPALLVTSKVTTATIAATPALSVTSNVTTATITATPALSVTSNVTTATTTATPVLSVTSKVTIATETSVIDTIIATPSTTSTIILQTPTLPTPTEAPVINLMECDKSINCFRKPRDCSSLSACHAIATFQFVKGNDSVVIRLATAGFQYVAFAQKKDDMSMVNIRGQYCGRASLFGSFHGNNLQGSGKPTFLDRADIDDIKFIEAYVNDDGVLICSFERAVKPSTTNKDYLYDMNEELYAFLSYGSLGGNLPTYHGQPNTLISSKKLNFLHVQTIEGRSAELTNNKKAHGILMIIAYVLLATSGILTARYMKRVSKDVKIGGKDAWFPFHQMIMLLCQICSITAFIIILVELQGWTSNAGRHQFTGLFAVIAFLIQPVMAAVRPAPDHKRRFIFTWAHRFVGMLGWLLGGLAVTFAFELMGKNYDVPIAFIIVTILLCLVLDICLCIFVKKEEAPAVVFNDSASPVDGRSPGVNIETNETVEVKPQGTKRKEKYIVLLFFVIIFVFALIIAIYLASVVGSW